MMFTGQNRYIIRMIYIKNSLSKLTLCLSLSHIVSANIVIVRENRRRKQDIKSLR
jgi:hypothetical protein